MKRIIVATDGSPSARAAVEVGLDVAREEDAAVTFVHVVDTPAYGARLGPSGPSATFRTAEDYVPLHEAADLASEAGVPADTELLVGKTVDEIVAYAESADADLIVVGSRGLGAVASVVLGSVSKGILRAARQRVLVVREIRVREEADQLMAR